MRGTARQREWLSGIGINLDQLRLIFQMIEQFGLNKQSQALQKMECIDVSIFRNPQSEIE